MGDQAGYGAPVSWRKSKYTRSNYPPAAPVDLGVVRVLVSKRGMGGIGRLEVTHVESFNIDMFFTFKIFGNNAIWVVRVLVSKRGMWASGASKLRTSNLLIYIFLPLKSSEIKPNG